MFFYLFFAAVCGCWNIQRVIPQVILKTLLVKAEEKLKDGERILKEHENIDSNMAVSKNSSKKKQRN